MWTIAGRASCCLQFDSCEQNSFISICKVPPQCQFSGQKGHIFTKNGAREAPYPWVKKWMVHVMPKLIYHANVKHLETKSEFERTCPWFETLKHWKQPTCCFSSRFVNRGYCGANRPCRKAWTTNWKMLAYTIHILSNVNMVVVFSFPPRIREKTTNTTSFENHYLFALQLSFRVLKKN